MTLKKGKKVYGVGVGVTPIVRIYIKSRTREREKAKQMGVVPREKENKTRLGMTSPFVKFCRAHGARNPSACFFSLSLSFSIQYLLLTFHFCTRYKASFEGLHEGIIIIQLTKHRTSHICVCSLLHTLHIM